MGMMELTPKQISEIQGVIAEYRKVQRELAEALRVSHPRLKKGTVVEDPNTTLIWYVMALRRDMSNISEILVDLLRYSGETRVLSLHEVVTWKSI